MAAFVLQLLPEAQKGLRAARRVLGMTTWAGVEWMDVFEEVPRVRPEKRAPRMMAPWTSVEGVRGELVKAGFVDVEVKEVRTTWVYESAEVMVEFMTNGGFPPMVPLLADLSGEEMGRLRAGMVRWIEERHGGGKGALEGTGLVGVGRKAWGEGAESVLN